MKKALLACFVLATLCTASCSNQQGETTATSKDSTGAPAMNNGKEANEERNKKTMMASVDALNKHDVDALMKDAAPDVIDYGDGTMPPMKSKDTVVNMMKAWMTAFPDFKADNITYAADGDVVMIASDCSGTWKGEFMGQKPTGKSFHMKDVDIFTFNDKGQFISHRSIQNMGPVFASLGMKMPEPMKK
jgi:predicted ester cyclase